MGLDRDREDAGLANGGPVVHYARMVSALLHDLRTPLASIVGAASSLQSYADRFDAATRQKLLQGIVEEAGHLDRLLANLSILAKARAGVLAPDRRPTRLSELLDAVATKAREGHETAHIAIAADAAESRIDLDTSLMQGALLNLIELAVRLAPDPVKIELSAIADGAEARIEVTAAIADAMHARLDDLLAVFSGMRPTHDARASQFILLDAAREVVQSHTGRLSVQAAYRAERLHIVVILPI